MNITTSNHRIHLRAMEPEDLDLLYRIENDTRLWNLSSSNVPYSRYSLHDFIANSTGDIYNDKQVRLIIENEESHVVGLVDIVNFDPRNRKAELGLIIESPFRRRGYAYHTLMEVARYAHDTIHLHQLYAIIDMQNIPSLELFRKLGYRESAVLREWLYDGSEYHDAVMMQTVF